MAVDEQQIRQWLKDGAITQVQAKKMLGDTSKYKKDKRSDKLIVTISIIGAILLGVGAILFIASNWRELSNLTKVIILVGSTSIAYFAGYFLKYQKQSLPTVGASLLFLGALLFGATVILISQIYNLNANNHVLVLIWLLGILPLVYALRSTPIAALASLLFYLWIALFFTKNHNSWWFFGLLGRFTLILFIAGSIMLFAFGGLHYLSKQLSQIARAYRIAGLKVLMLSLFLLTFDWFSKVHKYDWDWYNETKSIITIGIIIFSIIAILITVINWFFNNSPSLSKYEGPISLGLIGLSLIFFFYPSETSIYVLIFNLLFAGLTILFLYLGYSREDMKLVNLGMFWLAAFLVARYFDWFWSLLERSVFFLVGGLILILGGIALEKKRRQIKETFHAKK